MAEKFLVHPAALDGYAGLLERNNGHVSAMKDYLNGPHAEATGLMGVLFPLQNIAERLAAWQGGVLAEITEKLAATTEGVRDTATTYSEIDHAAGARLDEIAAKAPVDAEDD
jgi:hypothetical protein